GRGSSSTGGSSPSPAGSASPSAAPSAESPRQQQTIELRICWWGDADRAKLYDEILDMYEKQNPHIKTVREWTSFNDYWPKLATQVAGGNAPDIFSLHVLLYGGEYGSKDILEPLQPYVDRGLIDLDGWDE